MINRIVKMSFDPGRTDDFIKLFEERRHAIAHFEGCKGVKLLRDVQQTNIFFTYSLWESETALEKYRNSDLFNTVWAQTKQWFNDKPQAWSTEEKTF